MVYSTSNMAPYTAKLTILYGSRSIAAMVTSVATPATDSTEPTRWVTLLNRSPKCIDHPHRVIAVLSATPRFAASFSTLRIVETGAKPAQSGQPTQGILPPRRSIQSAWPRSSLFVLKKHEGRSPGFEACALLAPFSAFYSTCGKPCFKQSSVQRGRTQVADLLRRHRRTVVAPRHTNVRHHCSHFRIRQRLSERRHAIRMRVAVRARRVTAIEHHADRVYSRLHLDGLVRGKRRVGRRFAETIFRVALRAVFRVNLLALLQQFRTELRRCFKLHRFRRFALLRDRLQERRHGVDVRVRHVLQAVVNHFGHRAKYRAALRHAGLQQVVDVLDVPVAETRFLIRRQRRRIPVLDRKS